MDRRFILGIVMVVAMVCSMDASADLSNIVAGKVEKVASGFKFTEGPVWDSGGYLLFSDVPAGQIIQWSPKGQGIFREPSWNSNGLTFDPKGRLVACEHGNRRVSRTEKNGTIVTLANRYKGKRLNSPNDLCVRSDGTIYFTDPDFATPRGQKDLDFQGVFRINPAGKLFLEAKKNFQKPNGLALSPDERLLYVDDTVTGAVRVFRVQADGSLTGDRVFARIPPGVLDGMKVDLEGHLYVTAKDGIWVLDSSGNHLGTIVVPEQPANCAFGDRDHKTLYITARNSLYRVRLKIAGVPVPPRQLRSEGSGNASK